MSPYSLNINKSMFKQIRKAIAIIILVAFISTTVKSPAYAQVAAVDPMPFMPQPGIMVHLSPEYTPAYLKGIVIHPENALKFDFIIYKGDKELTDAEKKDEYLKLTKYFLASLAIPDDDQWVNLSPYEKDRIIKDDFGKTEMGRDLLAQDYMLKQITASLIYPESNLGKKFWDKVYTQAQAQYGTTSIPVNTFNKVWILPDDAEIYEKGNTAYVFKSHLKVMMEEDYLSLKKHSGIQNAPMDKKTHTIASKIVKEIVLPELEREVNEGKNFANLRQAFSGMVLAAWYKRALKESLLSKIYADKAKVKGVDQDPQTNEQIYQQYLKAYKKGVFNFIKEDVDKYTHETIPRKYFSGGVGVDAEVLTKALHPFGENDPRALQAANQVGSTQDSLDLLKLNLTETEAQAASQAMTTQEISPDTNGEVSFGPNTKAVTITQEGSRFSIVITRFADGTYLAAYGFGGKYVKALIDGESFTPPNSKVIIERHNGDNFTIYNGQKTKNTIVKIDQAMRVLPKLALAGAVGVAALGVNSNVAEAAKNKPVKPGVYALNNNQPGKEFNTAPLHMEDFNIDIKNDRLISGRLVGVTKKHWRLAIDLVDRTVMVNEISDGKAIVHNLGDLPTGTVDSLRENLGPKGLATIPAEYRALGLEILDEALVSKAMVTPPIRINQNGKLRIKIEDRVVQIKRGGGRKGSIITLHRQDDGIYASYEPGGKNSVRLEGMALPGNFEVAISLKGGDLTVENTGKTPITVTTDEAMMARMRITELGVAGAGTVLGVALLGPAVFEAYRLGVHNALDQINPSNPDFNAVFNVVSIGGSLLTDGSVAQLLVIFGRYIKEYVDRMPTAKELFDAAGERVERLVTGGLKEQAMVEPGGIDMNAANLNLQIKRDGYGVPLPISQQNLENIHIDGLIPVILDIRPATSTGILAELMAPGTAGISSG